VVGGQFRVRFRMLDDSEYESRGEHVAVDPTSEVGAIQMFPARSGRFRQQVASPRSSHRTSYQSRLRSMTGR
jgi:hypothetical protein